MASQLPQRAFLLKRNAWKANPERIVPHRHYEPEVLHCRHRSLSGCNSSSRLTIVSYNPLLMRQVEPILSDLSVIVLSHNRVEEVAARLDSLCPAAEETGYELIIVDNASTDGTRELLKRAGSRYKSLRVVLNDENVGVAEGRNSGSRIAQGRYLLFIDDDTSISIEDIMLLRAHLADNPHIGVVSPRVIHTASGVAQNEHGDVVRNVGNYHGACHIVRGEVLRKIGYVDPKCTFGGEELDVSIRVRSLGYEVVYLPTVDVYHNSFAREGGAGRLRRRMRMYNLPRLHFKYFPITTALMFTLRYSVSHLSSGVRTYGGAFAFSLMREAWRGAIDGRTHHQPINRLIVQYYRRSDTRPDIGNVGVSVKAMNKLSSFCDSLKRKN